MEKINLYHPVILQQSKEPCHFHKVDNAEITGLASNPICGDRFELFVTIEEEKVAVASFHGYGCAVSKAATSLLIQRILNQPLDKALQLVKAYLQMLKLGEGDLTDPELEVFKVARDYPGRLQCAQLSWQKMEELLESNLL
ncbi:MAG: SUF system NifU family Fe-S cluster assembly protein [Saprospiraceae bacterium]|nr:SUF system NifU family Fe-S cluster assembly protein [Saprospiraceae bacterium]